LIASEREDMQLAAMQQRMTVFLRAACSFPRWRLGRQLPWGSHLSRLASADSGSWWGVIPVVDDGRGDAAGADAARGHERELLVGRRLAGLDLRLASIAASTLSEPRT
jgi:hypothetical protein